MFSRISISIIILATTTALAGAFTIQVKDYECQERSIMADFTDICDDNMTCTFGEMAYVSGILNMTDEAVNTWDISADTTVYMDSRLHIATYHTQLLSMQPIYLCNQYLNDYERRQLDEGGEAEAEQGDAGYNYGSYSSGSTSGCPSAGLYSFENVALQLPSVPNKVYDWAATGWTGSVSIDMYLDSSKYQLIGRCQLNVVTHMDDSMKNGTSTNIVSSFMSALPEAGATGMIILGTFVAVLFLGFVGYHISGGDAEEEDMDGYKDMKNQQVVDFA